MPRTDSRCGSSSDAVTLLLSPTARSRNGARRRACGPVALALAALVALVAPLRASERQEGPPPWRVGGRAGFSIDAATFPEDSAGHTLEVYLRIPGATLAALGRDETGAARLRAMIKVRPRTGEELESAREFTLGPPDGLQGQGHVLLFRFPVQPGRVRVTARLEDQLSHKRRLLSSGSALNEAAEMRGELEVPRAQSGRDLSDLAFLWPSPARAPGLDFVRGGEARVPNPDRLYGLYSTTLRTAFSARSRPDDERAWRWVLRVLDDSGKVLAQRESTAVAGRFVNGSASFDLADQPAGAYTLDARVWQEGDAGALQRRARFSIGWDPETWNRSPADLADEAHLVLGAEQEDVYTLLQPGEQERMMSEFWRVRDPEPETAVNEALELFRRRIAEANDQFTRFGLERGMFSDMGRVWIRYGQPSEVLHQVMPAGEETLTKALREIIANEDREVGEVHARGPGGDQRPYEVWVYEGDIPLPFDADPQRVVSNRGRRRLLFLFVDEQGLGTFTLRYSTE